MNSMRTVNQQNTRFSLELQGDGRYLLQSIDQSTHQQRTLIINLSRAKQFDGVTDDNFVRRAKNHLDTAERNRDTRLRITRL